MEGRGRPEHAGQGGKGLDKEHTISRISPETGELEEQTITQRQWKDEGKALRDQGWTRPEDEEEEEENGDEDEGEMEQ